MKTALHNKKRFIGIMIALTFVVGVVIFEFCISSSYLNKTKAEANEIIEQIDESGVTSADVVLMANELLTRWNKRETLLALLSNNKDISGLKIEIVKLQNYIEEDDKEYAMESLKLILYYCENYRHFYGVTLENLI